VATVIRLGRQDEVYYGNAANLGPQAGLRSCLARRDVFPFRVNSAFLSVTTCGFPAAPYELNDAHFHLTNYIQQGTDIRDFLAIMGTKVGRVALLGIPL
jgi:hypothetical protein